MAKSYPLFTGEEHPWGAGLPCIILESDSRGGSSLVKKSDGFWYKINVLRRVNGIEIINEEVISNSDSYATRYAAHGRNRANEQT